MPLTRRDLLRAGSAAGALLLARPLTALAFDDARASRLFPGTSLAHADMHNHTLLSDGDGNPDNAFASMRDQGLDVAALTDHSATGKALPAGCGGCDHDVVGITEADWQRVRSLADAADDPGRYVAIRGFEWSSPTLGHMNVWFSEQWVDPLTTGGSGPDGLDGFSAEYGGPNLESLDPILRTSPARGVGMRQLYDWLGSPTSRPGLGGGQDGIAGFNHPGRERGRFGYFVLAPEVRDRVVSIEAFNRGEDYLFEGTDLAEPSPIAECLDAGWRTGLIGVSDEHGTVWGDRPQRGRAGLWVSQLSRAGVREAMLARRFFATIEPGLRLDAAANGARMGSTVIHSSGPVEFALDIARGPEWTGKALRVQVLQTGRPLPTVLADEAITVPAADQPLPRFTVPVDVANGSWVVLRVTDPERPADGRAPQAWRGFGGAVAYASPFFLQP